MLTTLIDTIFVLTHSQDIMAILAPIALVLVTLANLHNMSVPKRIPRELVLVAILLVYAIINVTINNGLVGITLIDYIKNYGKLFYTLGMFIIFLLLSPTKIVENNFYPAAIYAGFFVAIPAIYTVIVPSRHGALLTGLLGGHNVTAANLGVSIILFVIAIIEYKRDAEFSALTPKRQYYLMIAFVIAAFILAESRGFSGGLLFAVGLIWLSSLRKDISRLIHRTSISKINLVIFVGIILMVLAVLVALSARLTDVAEDPNVKIRLALWLRAIKMFLASPLTGVGLGTFEQTNIHLQELIPGLISIKSSGTYLTQIIHGSTEGGQHVHNLLLQFLSELGLVGTGLYIAFFVTGVRRSIPKVSGSMQGLTPEWRRISSLAQFNKKLALFLFCYLCFSGLSAGFTVLTPTQSWLMYLSLARFIRQQMHLSWLLRQEGSQTAASRIRVQGAVT